MLFYRAALPLSSQTLTYVAGVIRRHRRQAGSCWRKPGPGQQALLVLAYLRKGETFAELAAGFGAGTATAWRYVTETVALLAARSPTLHRALRGAKEAGLQGSWHRAGYRGGCGGLICNFGRVADVFCARFVRKFLQDDRSGGTGWMMARMLSQLPVPLLPAGAAEIGRGPAGR
jgi:hypothetical protein